MLKSLTDSLPALEDSDYLFAVIDENIQKYDLADAFENLMKKEFRDANEIHIKKRSEGISI
jgi:hypothetical protein